jgi:hypothetical protein
MPSGPNAENAKDLYRTAKEALGIVDGAVPMHYGNATTHEDIDRMYKEYIGTPEPGSFMESNLKAQHDDLDKLNAPKYSDRVKARRKARP